MGCRTILNSNGAGNLIDWLSLFENEKKNGEIFGNKKGFRFRKPL
ncbi:hypothetical protein Ataiwa_12200 [Algoriphagus taiwanensis]|uniref:Uncharacterized protein n=1 Tax=Algoriphagus taiwanensis TaxID=1445656 RepID=A0ABQ6Q0H4_9BACT|nr:hypothetical protein Ataiwa_12200 [Algoriphagus taiwanensis]